MSRFVRCLRILSLFGLLLWSHEGFAADTIGNAIIISGTVMGTSVEGTRHLNLLNEIHSNEIIETFDDSAAELEFFDATTLSLGPNTRITLDRFVYDPDPQNGAFEFTVTQGALRFASGVLPSDSYKIHTPVVTIAVPFWGISQARKVSGSATVADNPMRTALGACFKIRASPKQSNAPRLDGVRACNSSKAMNFKPAKN